MQKNYFLITWDQSRAQILSEIIKNAGNELTVETSNSSRALQQIIDLKPDVVLIDINSHPTHAKHIAIIIRSNSRLQAQPIYFLGGSQQIVKTFKALFRSASFVPDEKIESAI